MGNSETSISVIIPAYNAAHTICRAIDSVLKQTIPVMEIIAVDDGSTDKTAEIVHNYGDSIHYFYQDNQGLSGAMNSGLELANGKWIVILDADDEWFPYFIESHTEMISKNPDLKWTYSPCERVRRNGQRDSNIPEIVKNEIKVKGSVSYFRATLAGFSFGKCGLVIRREIFGEFGNFDSTMRNGMDGDMWRRIAIKYPQIGVSETIGWRYYCDDPDSLHTKGRWCRDLQMKSLCKNMRYVLRLNSDIVNEYGPYARMYVMIDLMREAARDCSIAPDIIKEAKHLFTPTMCERWLLRVLKLLPKPVAMRVVNRIF